MYSVTTTDGQYYSQYRNSRQPRRYYPRQRQYSQMQAQNVQPQVQTDQKNIQTGLSKIEELEDYHITEKRWKEYCQRQLQYSQMPVQNVQPQVQTDQENIQTGLPKIEEPEDYHITEKRWKEYVKFPQSSDGELKIEVIYTIKETTHDGYCSDGEPEKDKSEKGVIDLFSIPPNLKFSDVSEKGEITLPNSSINSLLPKNNIICWCGKKKTEYTVNKAILVIAHHALYYSLKHVTISE